MATEHVLIRYEKVRYVLFICVLYMDHTKIPITFELDLLSPRSRMIALKYLTSLYPMDALPY